MTTTTTLKTPRRTTVARKLSDKQKYRLYKARNPYEHFPLSYNEWRRKKLGRLPKTRIRRTDSPLLTNEIPEGDNIVTTHKRSVPALEMQTLAPPTTPAYSRPAGTGSIQELPEWHFPSSEKKVHFQSRGKMIGSLNFAHLIFDIDLKAYVDKARNLCGPEKKWLQNIQKIPESGRAVFEDVIKTYELQCKNLLFDLEETESIWLKGQLHQHVRVKRQFFLAGLLVGAAIVAVSSYFFSNSALIDISEGNSQNPITIRHLQDHETRISTNSRSITILKDHLTAVENQIRVDHDNIHILHLLIRTQDMLISLVRSTDHLISGLELLHDHRLSSKLIQTSQVVPVLKEMKEKLAKLNLIPAIDHAEDLYRLECSHMIFENGTIRVFVHIPAYRKGSLMDLHEYLGSPVHIGDGHFLHPQPFGTYLSSNPANNLFRTFTPQEFSLCREVSGTFYCKNTNWYRKRYQENCLINLYLGDTERIKQHCQFVLTQEEEVLTQINHNSFHSFTLADTEFTMHCPGHVKEYDRLTAKGTQRFVLRPSCSLSSPTYLMEGSADVFVELKSVRFHDLDIFTSDDLKEIKDNFHLLPEKSLDLIGSTKGLKITDIKAEFAAQRQAYHIRIGLLAGLAGLVLLVCLCAIIARFCPCKMFWSWLCRRPRQNRRRRRRHRSNEGNESEGIEMGPTRNRVDQPRENRPAPQAPQAPPPQYNSPESKNVQPAPQIQRAEFQYPPAQE